MLRHPWLGLVVAVLLAGCSSAGVDSEQAASSTTAVPDASTTTTRPPTPTTTTFAPRIVDAETYLLDAMELVETSALLADQIDWDTRRAEAAQVAAAAIRPSELHRFIMQLLDDLGDNHWTFVVDPQTEAPPEDFVVDLLPTSEVLEDRIGLIALGPWPIGPDEAPRYTQVAYEAMRKLEADGVCGWILDLRTNHGGYNPPMLASVVPFITDRQHDSDDPLYLGLMTDVAGDEYQFVYDGDSVEIEPWASMELIESHLLDNPSAPVAVLIGGETASSGEMTATVFFGRPNTRVFGFPTAGKPAGSGPFFLEDGAVMRFALTRFTDRQGHRYGPTEPLRPDESAGGTRPAIDWLFEQPACNQN